MKLEKKKKKFRSQAVSIDLDQKVIDPSVVAPDSKTLLMLNTQKRMIVRGRIGRGSKKNKPVLSISRSRIELVN